MYFLGVFYDVSSLQEKMFVNLFYIFKPLCEARSELVKRVCNVS